MILLSVEWLYSNLLPIPWVSVNLLLSTFESNTNDEFIAYIDPALANCQASGTAGTVITVPQGNLFDIGQDGVPAPNGTANPVAKDVYGFSLNYFNGDYKAVDAAVNPFAGISIGKDLFNGNIKAMAVNIPKLGAAQLYTYNYDQLNRITKMDAFTGLNGTTNVWTPVATDNYKERISYDANGNILTYKRNGNAARLAMDDMAYSYKPGTNQLDKVTDAAPDAAAGEYDKYNDIKRGQANGNYKYDAIGNLISDVSEGITNISWNVYGKIQSITKSNGTTITYTYDASGNRISKTANNKTTCYVRDAGGNVMSIYTKDAAVNNGDLTQSEVHLYGSSRIGIMNAKINVEHIEVNTTGICTFTSGNKFFELSNHLGNVAATASDKHNGIDIDGDGIIDYYVADVITASDYYPFGMVIPGRKYSSSSSTYRYGFNGKENDNEVKGDGNQQDYGMRIYDMRLGRFMSVDPLSKKYPFYSPYHFAGCNPIRNIDLDGAEPLDYTWNWKFKTMVNNHKERSDVLTGYYDPNDRMHLMDVNLVYDEVTKRSWFIHQDENTGQYKYWKSEQNNFYLRQVGNMTETNGSWEPFETQNQISHKATESLNRGIGTFMFGAAVVISAAPTVLAASPSLVSSATFLAPKPGFNPIGGTWDLINQTVFQGKSLRNVNWGTIASSTAFGGGNIISNSIWGSIGSFTNLSYNNIKKGGDIISIDKKDFINFGANVTSNLFSGSSNYLFQNLNKHIINNTLERNVVNGVIQNTFEASGQVINNAIGGEEPKTNK